MKIKNSKGISIITLSMAIIILILITSILIYNSNDGIEIKKLNNLYNDIESLNDKVSSYYLENGSLPISVEYNNSDVIANIEASGQQNPNDGSEYYILDLQSLEAVSLNYGTGYEDVDTSENASDLTNIYIINKVSHTIYYAEGVNVEGILYYTSQEDWQNIDLVVIPIYTAEQLSWIGDGQTHSIEEKSGIEYTFSLDAIYSLQNDIDLSSICYKVDGTTTNDVSWTPIGTQDDPFTGEFYGNGYEISNLYINTTESSQGLFGRSSGTIQDVTVRGEITATRWVAGVAGYNYGIIENCINYANIEGTNDEDCQQAGGIAGTNNGGNISNCYNYGEITSTGENTTGGAQIGGICGFTYQGATIEDCYNYGNVTANNITASYSVGGIVGAIGYETTSATVMNCYNTGEISGAGYVGGIAGMMRIDGGKIESCENAGKVNGEYDVGGICGYAVDEVSIIKSVNTGTVSVESYQAGGILGYVGDGACYIEYCYNIGNISYTGSGTISTVGGICGQLLSGGQIRNSYNVGTIPNGTNCGGIIGQNAGTITNCYYLNTSASSLYGTDTGLIDVASATKTTDEMKQTAFIELLNNGSDEDVWVQDVNNINQGFPILKWQLED